MVKCLVCRHHSTILSINQDLPHNTFSLPQQNLQKTMLQESPQVEKESPQFKKELHLVEHVEHVAQEHKSSSFYLGLPFWYFLLAYPATNAIWNKSLPIINEIKNLIVSTISVTNPLLWSSLHNLSLTSLSGCFNISWQFTRNNCKLFIFLTCSCIVPIF